MVAHRPPETVGLGTAEPGAVHRDLEDLLLVEHDAERFLEDRLVAGGEVHHPLLAPLPPQIWMHRSALYRSGADDRDLDDEIVEGFRARARQRLHLRPALDLEHADG